MKKKLILLFAAAVLVFGCTSTDSSVTEEKVGEPKNTEDTASAASENVDVLTAVAEKEGYEIINAAIVGDRVLDISASLGVMPKVISVRASQWPRAKTFPAKLVGCPVKVTMKAPETMPNVIAETGIDTVIVENNPEFCLLMKNADPMKVLEIVEGTGVKTETIDFSQGYDQAIRWIAKLYGKEAEGEALIKKYNREKAAAEAKIVNTASGKKVVVLSAVLKKETGRLFINAESKGFYTDKFFLEPFECDNVSDILNKDGNEITKGYFPVTNLRLLSEAAPDVIIIYGNAEELKAKINELAAKKADVAEVPAVKNSRIVQLPYYVGSDIEDYPVILTKWIDYFSSIK